MMDLPQIDKATDPISDVPKALDQMAAAGYPEIAMRLAEDLGIATGKELALTEHSEEEAMAAENLPPLSEAMVRIMEYADAKGVENLKALPGCWEEQIDDTWWIAFNGHNDARKVVIMGGRPLDRSILGMVEVPPFHILIVHQGDPLGFIHAFGGEMIYKKGADEESFIEAMKRATVREGGTPSENPDDQRTPE